MNTLTLDQLPTQEQIQAEGKRAQPWLFKEDVDLDLSGRRAKLGALQEAEDRLRVQRELKPKYYEQ